MHLQLSQAIAEYTSLRDDAERELVGQELRRFQRWLGTDPLVNSITRDEVERYLDFVSDQAGLENIARLDHLKAFLAHLHQKGYTSANLGALVKPRRAKSSPSKGTSEVPAPVVYMSRAGYEQLKSELARLEQEIRPQLAEAVRLARADGDLRENAPYHAARQELAQVQSRINQLRALLSAAEIRDQEADRQKIGLGRTVVVRDLDFDEEITLTLVGPGEIDPRRGRISIQSPVGKALMDRTEGDEVEVETPSGTTRYRIIRVVD